SRGIRCNTVAVPCPSSGVVWCDPVPSTTLPAAHHPWPRYAPRLSPRQPPPASHCSFPSQVASCPGSKEAQPSSSAHFSSCSSRFHLGLHCRLFGRIRVLQSRRRQQRRSLSPVRLLLHFHLAEQHRRRCGRNRHASALRSAHAVEHVLLVACRHDPRECRQRCSHNVHAAHQFVRPSIRVHLVHNHRQYLERLRQRSCRQRESSLNIV